MFEAASHFGRGGSTGGARSSLALQVREEKVMCGLGTRVLASMRSPRLALNVGRLGGRDADKRFIQQSSPRSFLGNDKEYRERNFQTIQQRALIVWIQAQVTRRSGTGHL
jgi:hypothetical protein